jgi:hypothetical protein
VAGAASYTWAGPAGVTIVPSGTSASYTFPTIYTTGLITVTANGTCSNSSAVRGKTVTNGKPGTPSAITGPAYGNCNQSGVGFSISSVIGATSYTWTPPAGVTITGGSTTSILATFPSVFTSGTFSVTASNSCGTSAARTLVVYGAPSMPTAISGPAAPCSTTVQQYTTGGSPNATTYQWTAPAGSTFLGSVTGTTVLIQWGSVSGNVTVRANNSCGWSGTRTFPVTISCREGQVLNAAESFYAEVYPNPSEGNITLKFIASTSSKYVVKVLDMTGRVVISDEGKAQEGVNLHGLNLTSFAKGIYLVTLQSGDYSKQMKVIVE